MNNTALCSGYGQFHSDKNGQPYITVTLANIEAMTETPTSVAKDKGQWFIPSNLLTRELKKQQLEGLFYAVWIDIDKHATKEQIQDILATLGCYYLLYSTRSSTEIIQKWRVIIPLPEPVIVQDFIRISTIVNNRFERAGIEPDRASQRANQLCYLPNKGDFYDYHIERNQPPLDWQNLFRAELEVLISEEKRRNDEIRIAGNRSLVKAKELTRSGKQSPIIAFNNAYPVTESLERYGYKKQGRIKWLSPNSESGRAGVTVKQNRWISSHSSDKGIGQTSQDGKQYGDAFDLFVFYEHGGDKDAAIKAAGAMFGTTKANQINYMKAQPERITQPSMANDFDDASFEEYLATLDIDTQPIESKALQVIPVKSWEDELADHVEQFNKIYKIVIVGGKHRIMREITDNENNLSYEYLEQSEISKYYQNTSIKVGETLDKHGKVIGEKFLNHYRAWATHPNCLKFQGVDFKPEKQVQNGYFNLWTGYTVEPKKGDWRSIQNHIELVICNGDEALAEYLYRWLAYIFQYPDKPAGSAIVMRGVEGIGKGILAEFIKALWGQHGFTIHSGEHFTGRFNGHLENKCFLFIDEAFFSGDKKSEGVLKARITEPTIVIENKGLKAETRANYSKVLMSTNNEWAVPASKDSRRYCVCDVSSHRLRDRDYFNQLLMDIKNKDIQAAFLFDMLNRDITGFHTGDIPETEGLKEQRLHSLDSIGQWLVGSLDNEVFEPTANQDWQSVLTSKDLESSYLNYCDNRNISEHNRKTSTAIGTELTRIGFDAKRELHGRKKQTVRILGTLEEAREKVENYYKITKIGKN